LRIISTVLYPSKPLQKILVGIVLLYPRKLENILHTKRQGRTAEHLIIVSVDLTVLTPISVTAVIAGIVIAVSALNVTWCVLTMRNICVLCFQNHFMYVMAAKILKAVIKSIKTPKKCKK